MKYPVTRSLCFFLAACGLARAQLTTYTLTQIPAVGVATAINDRGQVLLSLAFTANHNVIYSQEADTTTGVLSDSGCNPVGFNNLDQIVAGDSTGFDAATYQDGATGIPMPFYFAPEQASQPTAINDAGAIVGTVLYGNVRQGALYQNGKTTPVNYPGASQTFPAGINDAGEIVGSYYDAAGAPHGFVYQSGRYSTLDVPQTRLTIVNGVNNLGQIVGYYTGLLGVQRGFVYSGGVFQTINLPSYEQVWGKIVLTAINDEGQIAGYAGTDQPFPFIETPNYFSGF